jgi:hypothetical protein
LDFGLVQLHLHAIIELVYFSLLVIPKVVLALIPLLFLVLILAAVFLVFVLSPSLAAFASLFALAILQLEVFVCLGIHGCRIDYSFRAFIAVFLCATRILVEGRLPSHLSFFYLEFTLNDAMVIVFFEV